MTLLMFFGDSEINNKPILIVTAGQSNHNGNKDISNLTELGTLRPDLLGIVGEGNVYSFASNGLPKVYNYGDQSDSVWNYFGAHASAVSFHSSLFHDLYNNVEQEIYFVKHGADATQLYEEVGFTDWNINSIGEYYDDMTDRIDVAVAWMETNKGVQGIDWYFAAFCWFQGEADALSQVKWEAYEQNEIDLINDFRIKYGNKILFINAGLKGRTTINPSKIANTAKDERNFYMDNEDEVFGDGIHHTTQSNINIGEKFANIFNQKRNLFL